MCCITAPLTVDVPGHEVRIDGSEIALTATEFDLLAHLMRRPGHRLRHASSCSSEVWGYASTAGGRTVDVHVAQVRRRR